MSPPLDMMDPASVGVPALVAAVVAAVDRALNYAKGKDAAAAKARQAAKVQAEIAALADRVAECLRQHDAHRLTHVESKAQRERLADDVRRLEATAAELARKVEQAQGSVGASLEPLRSAVHELQVALARMGRGV